MNLLNNRKEVLGFSFLIYSAIKLAFLFTLAADARAERVGTNDSRVSDMGPDGDASYGLSSSTSRMVAYNPTNNEYLVVWIGDDNTGTLVDNEYEVFGQRINASTGEEVGTNDFRISDMGPDGDTNYRPFSVAVVYNSTNNEYLVVWSADDNTAPQVDGEFEIFAQRINAATGAEVGTNDFKISDMGTDGNITESANQPAVAYNSVNNQYLVVWRGTDDTAPLGPNENEVFGQRLDGATGAEIGTNDFRISDMGTDGDASYSLQTPDIAYNSINNEYLVVWSGDDNTGTLVDNENEIFGQRLDGATGAELGTNDQRISNLGPDGNANFDADVASVAYNSLANEYLVVYTGDDNTGGLIDNESEVFGQRLNAATLAALGTTDFRISDMGTDGNASFQAFLPTVIYNSISNEYMVTWYSDDNTGSLVDGEFEVYGQRLDGTTASEIGENDFRVSDAGPDGDANYDATSPSVVLNTSSNQYLFRWGQDDNTGSLVDNETEVYIQRFIFASADLSVSLADASDPITAGQNITYTVSVSNGSSGNAYGLSVVTTLASGITFQSASGSGWNCSNSGQDVTCTRDTLSSSATSEISIVGTVALTISGTVQSSVVISTSKSLDGTSSNDSANVSTTINPAQSDLTATLSSVKRKNNKVSGSLVCNNTGAVSASASKAKVYLSKNSALETSKDVVIKTASVPAINAGSSSSLIKFNKKREKAPKRFYVIAVCDSASEISESSETNNSATSQLK